MFLFPYAYILIGKIYIFMSMYIVSYPPFPEAKCCGVPSHTLDKSGHAPGEKNLWNMMFIPSFMKIGQMVQILLEESET
jgi:hypothetical protein